MFKESHEERLISEIHQSDMFGNIFETGCGHPLSQALYNVGGASKTINASICLYSKTEQEKIIGKTRSVSEQAVKKLMDYYDGTKILSDHTFAWASSWQVSTREGELTHGWIAYKYKDKVLTYHLTFVMSDNRKGSIEQISLWSLFIMAAGNDLKKLAAITNDSIYNCPIDVINTDLGEPLICELVNILKHNNVDLNPLYITPQGNFERVETLLRASENIMLYKGSFNPITNFHLKFANDSFQYIAMKSVGGSIEKPPIQHPVFCLSMSTLGKGEIDMEALKIRLEMFKTLNIPVMIFMNPYFNENVECLRDRGYEGIIYLPVGADTINRVIDSTYNSLTDYIKETTRFQSDFKNCKFLIAERTGYEINPILKQKDFSDTCDFHIQEPVLESATQIRKHIENGEIQEAERLMPLKISQIYISWFLEINEK